MMTDNRIRDILVVGGGTAGWMAAATLARLLPKGQAKVRLIESEEIGIIGVGEATVPLMQIFNGMLGIDEREFICATQGSFKLGIEFVDWGTIGNRHFHGFGDFGEFVDGIAPRHYWMKLRELGDPAPLAAYSFPTVLAMKNRFAPPAMRGGEPENYKYAYQFDASLYARYLRGYAERLGVERLEGRVVEVAQQPETGFVEAVTTTDGRRLEGGPVHRLHRFSRILIEETLKAGYEDWSKWLPCDRAVAVPCEQAGPFTPYTRSTAHEAGWQWRIPLQHRVGNGYVYSSGYISDDEAAETLLAQPRRQTARRPARAQSHRRPPPQILAQECRCAGPCVRFPRAAGITSIMLIQTGLARLIEMFPSKDYDPILSRNITACASRISRKSATSSCCIIA